jgi:hypothetical protein
MKFAAADDLESAPGQMARHVLKFNKPDRLHTLCVPRRRFKRRGRSRRFRAESVSLHIVCVILQRIWHNH